MIKIKLFNSKTPTESQELDLAPAKMINGECFIGRSHNCDIVLNSPEVSRVHGSICFESEQYYFTDLASLGGSRLNDKMANVNQKYVLKIDDIIRIGEFVLTIKAVVLEARTTTLNVEKPIESVAPLLHPREYMPVALVPLDQMSRWMKGELTVRCVAVVNETHDVQTFRFAADPPVLFTYQPGQFVTLNLEINGKVVKRSYSISSTPSRPHSLEITVKRVPPPSDALDAPAGLVSNWLHDNIRVGSEIKLSGPLGKFTCFANPTQKMLMISAGSGITPMMSMSRWVLDTAADCDIVFLNSARSPRDIIFRQELEWISSRHPKFRLAITTTRSEPGQAWLSFTGRFTPSLLSAIAPDFLQRTVYVCGPNAFMQEVKAMLEGLGFPMQNYYEESFGGVKKLKNQPLSPDSAPPDLSSTAPAPSPSLSLGTMSDTSTASPSSAEPVTSEPNSQTPVPVASAPVDSPASKPCLLAVVFAKSGKEVTCDGQDSILNLAEQEGVNIDSSCRSGVCGTCKQRKLEGEVKYQGDPDALDDSERDEGYILTCIAYPVGRVLIDA